MCITELMRQELLAPSSNKALVALLTGDRMRRNSLELCQEGLGWKNFFTERVFMHWNWFPREVVESPPLKDHLDVEHDLVEDC